MYNENRKRNHEAIDRMPQHRAPNPVRRVPASSPPPARRSKLFYVVLLFAGLAALSLTTYLELKTSRLQAAYFAGIARDMKFAVQAGPSASIHYPQAGPYDQRLGYSELPAYIE